MYRYFYQCSELGGFIIKNVGKVQTNNDIPTKKYVDDKIKEIASVALVADISNKSIDLTSPPTSLSLQSYKNIDTPTFSCIALGGIAGTEEVFREDIITARSTRSSFAVDINELNYKVYPDKTFEVWGLIQEQNISFTNIDGFMISDTIDVEMPRDLYYEEAGTAPYDYEAITDHANITILHKRMSAVEVGMFTTFSKPYVQFTVVQFGSNPTATIDFTIHVIGRLINNT